MKLRRVESGGNANLVAGHFGVLDDPAKLVAECFRFLSSFHHLIPLLIASLYHHLIGYWLDVNSFHLRFFATRCDERSVRRFKASKISQRYQMSSQVPIVRPARCGAVIFSRLATSWSRFAVLGGSQR